MSEYGMSVSSLSTWGYVKGLSKMRTEKAHYIINIKVNSDLKKNRLTER